MIARPFQGRLGGVLLFAMAAASVLLAVTLSSGADHRDGPASTGDAPADITDVYAFRSPAANDNLVIAVGVNGLTAPAGNTSANFNNAVTYTVHVDGDGNIATDEATVSVTFSGAGDQQKFTINGLGAAIVGDVTPPSGTTTPNAPKITTAGAIKAFAGQRDDAFFFDLDAFKKFVATPCVPASGLRCAGDGAPADTFKGTNVSYIVIELPVTAVTGQPTSATGTIKAWASTSRAGAQVDRMAIPAINTALIPAAQKDAFNQGNPGTDAATWNATGKTTIDGLRAAVDATFGNAQDGGPLGNLTSQQVADALIPDIVTINFAQPVQFPNGRRLQDDVIDAALGIVLNRGGAAGIADGIAANDKTFGAAFPYLADPFQPAATPAPTASPTPAAGQLPGTGGDQSDGMSNVWMIAIALAGAALVLGGGTLAVQRRSR